MASCDALRYDLLLYFKLVYIFKLFHKALNDGLPELLSKDICPNIATVTLYLEKTAYSYPDLILTRYTKDSLARSLIFMEHC